MAKAIAATPTEGRNRTMIIVAVVFAAIAALLLFVWLQGRDGGGATAAVTTDVVVASRDIEANTTLTADMLEVRAVPIDQAVTGAFTGIEAVLGLPLRFPIQAGEQVTSAKVGVDVIRDEKDLSYVLQPGKRAVAVEVTEMTSVGGLLLPGNFVDLIVVLDGGAEGLADNKAVTVLENVEVLAVAQEAQEPVPAAGTSDALDGDEAAGTGVRGQRPDEVERQPRARTVTLAVTSEQALLLALLQAEGDSSQEVEIMLALRPVGETDPVPSNELFPPRELILPAPPEP